MRTRPGRRAASPAQEEPQHEGARVTRAVLPVHEADSPTGSQDAGWTPQLVLNVGCGFRSGQGLHSSFLSSEWRELRLDINPAVQPDILCSMLDMAPVASSSIDAVWSSHNLEHLYRHEVPVALREFLRVLRPGGFALLTLPDLQTIAELIVADALESEAYRSPSGPITPLDMIYGHTPSLAQGNQHMAHKTGFTARTLGELLTGAGFDQVTLRRDGFALWARAVKPAA
jgi:SAM-dependent methyltransferase